MSTDLDVEVRGLLKAHRGDWLAVAKEAQVSYSWLSKFANEHIANPGYATLKRLHAALTDPAGHVAKRAEARRILEAR